MADKGKTIPKQGPSTMPGAAEMSRKMRSEKICFYGSHWGPLSERTTKLGAEVRL